jgi:hypothetical protein
LLKVGFKAIGKLVGVPDVVGDTVGGVIGEALDKANPEGGRRMCRPKGKAPQPGCGTNVFKTQPYPVSGFPKAQLRNMHFLHPHMGGSLPVLVTTASSYIGYSTVRPSCKTDGKVLDVLPSPCSWSHDLPLYSALQLRPCAAYGKIPCAAYGKSTFRLFKRTR